MSLNLRIKLILCALFTVLHINVKAQAFSVSSPSEVQLGQQFKIRYTVDDGDFDDIKLPSFEGFKLVGGPNRSNNFSMINGVTSRKSSLEYSFLAVQKGTLVVQPATAIVNGKSYISRQLVIKVQGEKPQPQNLEGSKNIFVRAEIEPNDNYYIGQQLLIKYKLYYNKEVRMNQILDEDTYNDMMQQYVQLNGNEAATTIVNGRQYNVATFKAIALYPQKVGQLSIKSMVLQVGIADETSEDFGFFTSRNYIPVNLISNELRFEIKPWPENAPPSFTGAVGKYSMSAYLDKNLLKPNGTTTLQLSVEGNGYPRTINGPIQSFGEDIEVYEPKKVDGESGYSDNEIKHNTSFEYYLIPKKEGTFMINPKFTYLDPELGSYVTLDSPGLQITVTNQAESNGSNEESGFQETASNTTQNPNTSLYGILGALIFGLIGFGMWWKFMRKPSPKGAKPILPKAVKVDKKDPKSFHRALAEMLYQQVAVKYGVSPKDFNVYHITALLNGKGKKEASLLFEEIIQACDLAVYGGLITDESINTLQQKADQLSRIL
jgi:hypothetical protein